MKPNPHKVEFLNNGILLSPKDVENMCNYAVRKSLNAIVIPPRMVEFAASLLRGSEVKIVTYVNYPKADLDLPAVEFVVMQAVFNGANIIELTLPLALVKERKDKSIKAVLTKFVETYRKVGVKIRVHLVYELCHNLDDLQFLAKSISNIKNLDCIIMYNRENLLLIEGLNIFKEKGIAVKIVDNFHTKKQYNAAIKGAKIICTRTPEILFGYIK